MGIIAWIVLGLAAGLIANLLIPGKRSQGLILTCLIGVAGALAGGWVASRLFHIHSLQGFFNLSTWLTAIAGAAVLLLASHLVTGQSRRPAGSRTAKTHRARLRHSADPGATVPDVITALAGDVTTAGAVRPSRSPGTHQCAAIFPPCPASGQRRISF